MKESPNKFSLPALRAGAQYLLGKGKKEAVKKGTDVVKNVVKTTKKTKKTKPKATNVDDVTKTTTKTTTKQPTKKELQKQLEDQKKQIDELLNKTDISTQLKQLPGKIGKFTMKQLFKGGTYIGGYEGIKALVNYFSKSNANASNPNQEKNNDATPIDTTGLNQYFKDIE